VQADDWERVKVGHAAGGYNICSAQLNSDFSGASASFCLRVATTGGSWYSRSGEPGGIQTSKLRHALNTRRFSTLSKKGSPSDNSTSFS